MKIGLAAVLALLIVGAGLVSWPWRVAATKTPRWNILLITLDTTRADRLGCYDSNHDTPAIDAFSRSSVRFDRCYAPAPLTLPSHCSLMTGLTPPRHGVHQNGPDRLDSEFQTLAEVLRENGYETAAVVGAFVLDRKFGLSAGFDHYDDQMPEETSSVRYAERRAHEVTDAALQWLKQPRNSPFFLWVHYFDAHAPYDSPQYDPAFATRRPYDAEIHYVDRQVGRLLAALPASDEAPTLVILTADHGEGLGQHGEDTHGLFSYDQTLRVPLLVRLPDGRHAGQSIDAPVALVDVMPSLLAWLDIETSAALDGLQLPLDAADAARTTDRAIYFENEFPTHTYGWSGQEGIVAGRHKLIRTPQFELYDLEQDPDERNNVFDPDSERSRRLLSRLEDVAATLAARSASTMSAATLEDEDVARLHALGYVGVTRTPRPDAVAEDLPNPKNMLDVYAQVQTATHCFEQRQFAAATNKLLQVIAADPGNKRALRLLAASALNEGIDRSGPIDAMLVAVQDPIRPSRDTFVLGKLGLALLAEQRGEEAVAIFRKLQRLDPSSAAACASLAEALRQVGNSAEAAQWKARSQKLARPCSVTEWAPAAESAPVVPPSN
ncbi:MAG: hypothetical protein DWQ37_18690 [Planctomycetota bacterium]|nr:MAG: hypothetical protein DWQ37_18690 [Planctomycetota bacterium]